MHVPQVEKSLNSMNVRCATLTQQVRADYLAAGMCPCVCRAVAVASYRGARAPASATTRGGGYLATWLARVVSALAPPGR